MFCGRAATSPDFSAAMGPCGAAEANCSQEQAVPAGSVVLFLFLLLFVRRRARSRACQCAFSEALGFGSEPAQGIVSF